MNKRWPYGRQKHAGKKHALNKHLGFGEPPPTPSGKEVNSVDDSKNILTSKTAWVFCILLFVGILKATGAVSFELTDSEAEGVALGIVAVIGLVLRLVSSQPVHILPVK